LPDQAGILLIFRNFFQFGDLAFYGLFQFILVTDCRDNARSDNLCLETVDKNIVSIMVDDVFCNLSDPLP
jgi:hypothetical protein